MGQAAIPIAMAVASVAVNETNQRRTSRKQDAELARGIIKQQGHDRDARSKVGETLDKFEDSSTAPIKSDLNEKFLQQLRANMAQGMTGFDNDFEDSDAFTKLAGKEGAGAVSQADRIAGLMAGIEAPRYQRSNERFALGDNAMDLDVVRRNAGQDDYLTRLRASRIRPNPLLGIIAAALGGASSGASANMGVPKAAAGATATTNFNTGMGLDKFTFGQPYRLPGRV